MSFVNLPKGLLIPRVMRLVVEVFVWQCMGQRSLALHQE